MDVGATIMIQLIASASDGWALAREGERLSLVRPPYRQEDRVQITAAQAERALADEDFVLDGDAREFAGWGDLCRYLEGTRVQRASPEELEQAREAALRLLAHADREQVSRHLAQVRARMDSTPGQSARQVLVALLGAESVKSDPALITEIQELLTASEHTRRRLFTSATMDQCWPVEDERAVAETAATIRDRRSVLMPRPNAA